MVYTLGALLVVAVAGAIVWRLGPRGHHAAWVGSTLVTFAGFAALVAALATGNLGVFYLSAVVLAVGVPLSFVSMIAVYRDRRKDRLLL